MPTIIYKIISHATVADTTDGKFNKSSFGAYSLDFALKLIKQTLSKTKTWNKIRTNTRQDTKKRKNKKPKIKQQTGGIPRYLLKSAEAVPQQEA